MKTPRVVRALVVLLLAGTCGCGATQAPPVGEPTTAATSPSASSSTASAEPPPKDGDAVTKTPPSPLPPSGHWDLRVAVVRDTCTPKVVTSVTQKGLLVYGHTVNGKTTLNLPLIVTSTTTIARQDVQAKLGLVFTAKSKDSTCPAYEVGRTLVVREVSHDRIVLQNTMTYGDRTGCPAGQPASCETETEETFTLVRSACEAPCAGQPDLTNPKEPKVKCTCP